MARMVMIVEGADAEELKTTVEETADALRADGFTVETKEVEAPAAISPEEQRADDFQSGNAEAS
jgi:hypothetical protein